MDPNGQMRIQPATVSGSTKNGCRSIASLERGILLFNCKVSIPKPFLPYFCSLDYKNGSINFRTANSRKDRLFK